MKNVQKTFMTRAIELAKLGGAFVQPNPLVGAVIVKDNKIVAEGYHHRYGDLHAERDAIEKAKALGLDITASEIYVTLEPCCHFGKQPPCTQAIVDAGIKKVIIGSGDPNPLVNGKGIEFLKNNGIEVIQDFMKEECDAINHVFFHYIKTKTPYVILKYAMTADGMTATSCGKSKWVTEEKARKNVHYTRACCGAVMAGISTVLKDNPLLNVRLENKDSFQPARIILDKNLQLSLESNLVKTADKSKVIVFCSSNLNQNQINYKTQLENQKIEVISVSVDEENHLNLEEVLKIIAEKKISSIFVESGGNLNSSFLFGKKCLTNEIHAYIAPKIFGNDGKNIFCPVKGRGVESPEDSIKLSQPEIEVFDGDVLLKYKVLEN